MGGRERQRQTRAEGLEPCISGFLLQQRKSGNMTVTGRARGMRLEAGAMRRPRQLCRAGWWQGAERETEEVGWIEHSEVRRKRQDLRLPPKELVNVVEDGAVS